LEMYRTNAFDELNRFLEDIGFPEPFVFGPRLLGTGVKDNDGLVGYARRPRIGVEQTESHYILSAEIPGARKEDIKITTLKNSLEVKVETSEKKHEGKEKECVDGKCGCETETYSSFHGRWSLPSYVDASKAEPSYENGVLKVKMPKIAAKEDKPVEIPVK